MSSYCFFFAHPYSGGIACLGSDLVTQSREGTGPSLRGVLNQLAQMTHSSIFLSLLPSLPPFLCLSLPFPSRSLSSLTHSLSLLLLPNILAAQTFSMRVWGVSSGPSTGNSRLKGASKQASERAREGRRGEERREREK